MAKVMVIEDDPDLNEILAGVLQSRSLEVTSAFLGEAALEMFEESDDYDLVISDVLLPGMDGVETLSKLKALKPQLRCIIITGYTTQETPVRAIRLNVDDYLFKPFSTSYLMKVVNRVLDAPAASEKNQERFRELFNKYGLSLGGIRDVTLSNLIERREQAFRGLFVGVRSAYLSEAAAIRVYAALEDFEGKFRTVLHKPKFSPFEAADVEQLYTLIVNQLDSLRDGVQGHRPPDLGITDEQFRPLFNAMKDGSLSLQDLLYAPLLRKTPDSRFETLRDLLELKKQLWPHG